MLLEIVGVGRFPVIVTRNSDGSAIALTWPDNTPDAVSEALDAVAERWERMPSNAWVSDLFQVAQQIQTALWKKVEPNKNQSKTQPIESKQKSPEPSAGLVVSIKKPLAGLPQQQRSLF